MTAGLVSADESGRCLPHRTTATGTLYCLALARFAFVHFRWRSRLNYHRRIHVASAVSSPTHEADALGYNKLDLLGSLVLAQRAKLGRRFSLEALP